MKDNMQRIILYIGYYYGMYMHDIGYMYILLYYIEITVLRNLMWWLVKNFIIMVNRFKFMKILYKCFSPTNYTNCYLFLFL